MLLKNRFWLLSGRGAYKIEIFLKGYLGGVMTKKKNSKPVFCSMQKKHMSSVDFAPLPA